MQRFFISLFCLFSLISGPISAWADCFRHSHWTVEEEHHHGAISDSHHGDSEHDHSPPGFIVLSSGSISSRLRRYQQRRPETADQEYKLASHSDSSVEQTSLNAQNRFISSSAGRFPRYPFLVVFHPTCFSPFLESSPRFSCSFLCRRRCVL